MPSDPYHEAIARLTVLGPLRVWSLLVTVFGDLAPDDALDGPTLSAILSEIGIKPEASRVALHRLRADGWITSEKTGRTSRHRLSVKGRADSDAARPRIYAAASDMPVHFALMPDGKVPDPEHYAPISPRLFVAAASTPPPGDALILNGDAVPRWLRTTAETEDLRTGYAALHDALSDLNLPDAQSLGPLRVAVIRVLIVHAWRRLALKHPMLPRALYSDAWRGHDCRTQVMDHLAQLPRPALNDI
ncbi:PaaX family transcriptional regulator C-terminal domain-containing protein [uncultured Tateyamaria sp.]|uniref:PaaX family transcriptional regulator C-terminal domain-containing protein n=1 Tax=Tateyamaria sp. 1078 TaxID=3417464 RepID=UPI00261E831B|nr:PaaX family transcriptional regulator C-terminal domain-containing protein [uncultured Tateyamaria sp.]